MCFLLLNYVDVPQQLKTNSHKKEAMSLNRWTKAWIIITICALLAWTLRWFLGVILTMGNVLVGTLEVRTWWRLWLDYVLTGLIGDPVRISGAILALFSIYLIWGPKPQKFFIVRKYVVVAILCEAGFYLAQLPLMVQEIIVDRRFTILYVGYLLQILLASLPLIVLSLKVWRYSNTVNAGILKWAGLAGLSYLAGMWVNNLLSSSIYGLTSIRFLNSAVTLSIALVLAIIGFFMMMKNGINKQTIRFFAAAFIVVGLHFSIFILYSFFTNALQFALLVEIWPVTFLGLGFSLLREKIDMAVPAE